ncbi:MAG: hypothetical protein R2773_05815 [Flavobacteriaceae bacterium]
MVLRGQQTDQQNTGHPNVLKSTAWWRGTLYIVEYHRFYGLELTTTVASIQALYRQLRLPKNFKYDAYIEESASVRSSSRRLVWALASTGRTVCGRTVGTTSIRRLQAELKRRGRARSDKKDSLY